MITIVGMGPGSKDYLTPAAVTCLNEANVIFVAPRYAELLREVVGERLNKIEIHNISSHLDELLPDIESNKDKNMVIAVSGDPGFFSLQQTIRSKISDIETDVVPGISSMQVLFAYIGKSWSNVVFTSVHGRSIEGLIELLKRSKAVCIVTDENMSIAKVAQYLADNGVKGSAAAGFRLSYPDQVIVEGTIDMIAKQYDLLDGILYIEMESK